MLDAMTKQSKRGADGPTALAASGSGRGPERSDDRPDEGWSEDGMAWKVPAAEGDDATGGAVASEEAPLHATVEIDAFAALLDWLGVPFLLLDGEMRARRVGVEFAGNERLRGILKAPDGETLADGDALAAAVRRLATERPGGPDRETVRQAGMVVSLTPLAVARDRASGASEPAERLLLATFREASAAGENIASDLKLTRVEEQLVGRLAHGMTVKEAAADMRISYHTARKYVQNIFAKTGVKRQAELIARLSGGRRFPPAPSA